MKTELRGVTRGAPTCIAMVLLALAALCSVQVAMAAVIEFYNPDLDNYFITADPVEQDFVDTGAVGRWERTGNAFAAGGPDLVCRFYGNSNTNPATGTFYGPNSHFYTASPTECEGLKAQYAPNAKSWKFESNDFATTIAANGSCAGNLVPVYRAYNNGFARGVDSNHRITSSPDDYQSTIARGWIGEGVVMCAPNSGLMPVRTAIGNALGEVVSKTIGAAVGSLSSADGRMTVFVPAGALAADAVIGIQPIDKPARTAVGGAYRLTPDGQAFLKPVTLTFTYADADVEGSAPEFLDVAFQNAEGYWQLIGEPALDVGAKSVSVGTMHFSDYVMVRRVFLLPPDTIVRVSGTQALQVRVCFDVNRITDGKVAYDFVDCDTPQGAGVSISVNDWSVDGVPGGNGVIGRVRGSGANATYTAPPVKPSPNVVVASARVHFSASGTQRTVVVRSRITITEASWTGWAESLAPFALAEALVVEWHEAASDNNVITYRPQGFVQAIPLGGCTVTPHNKTITAADGFLTIDYNFDPPRYHGIGTTEWMAAWECGELRFNALMLGWWFGGTKRPNGRTEGTVDPDGKTIKGTDSVGEFELKWEFKRTY